MSEIANPVSYNINQHDKNIEWNKVFLVTVYDGNNFTQDPAIKLAKNVRVSDPCINNHLNGSQLLEIFSYLKFVERCKLEIVCKKWKMVIDEMNRNQKALAILGPHENTTLHNFCTDNDHRVNVFNSAEKYWGVNLADILRKTPNIVSLHIRCGDYHLIKDGEGSVIADLCPKLEHLSFVDDRLGRSIYNEAIPIIENCWIKHLQLRFPIGIHNMGVDCENKVIRRGLELFEDLEILSVNIPLEIESCDIMSKRWLRKLALHGTSIPTSALIDYMENTGQYLKVLSIAVDDDEQLEVLANGLAVIDSLHIAVGVGVKNLRYLD